LRHRAATGFSLLEVLVAVTILAVALVTVLGLHARNIRLTARAQDLTMAGMLASCLAAVTSGSAFPPLGVTRGDFDPDSSAGSDLGEECRGPDGERFVWRREVKPIEALGGTLSNLKRVHVTVGTSDEPSLAELQFLVRGRFG